MRRLGSQDGQATIDYVALIALLAVLVTVTASMTGFAPGIVNATLGQFRRALCVVRGGDCPSVALAPCVVASKRDTHLLAVSIALFRADENHVVLRERMSDGTVRLTVSEQDGAGVTAGVGVKAELGLDGRTIGVDGGRQGSVVGVFGHGSVYVARDDREADDILRALRSGIQIAPGIRIGGRHPKAQSQFFEGGVRGLNHLGLGSIAAGASLDAMAGAMLGASRSRESGEMTISLSAGGSGLGLLTMMLAGPVGANDAQVALALKLDRHGTPIALSLEAAGSASGGASLPSRLARLVGTADDRDLSQSTLDTAGRRWELGAQVDLRDPDIAAAWKAFRHDPTSGDAIRALGTVLRDRSQLDVRSYAMRSDSSGASVGVAVGLKLGAELGHSVDRSELLSASTRPPEGLWERRFDCRRV